MFKTILSLCILTGLFSTPVFAAPPMMDHSQMGGSTTVKDVQPSPSLSVLDKAPASGKAREAGFDNSYFMKQTTVESSDKEKCVLASRGIIMLDRDGWKKCGVVMKDNPKQSRIHERNSHAGH